MIALFPGQGSQTIGMGKDFFDHFSYVRELYQIADEVTGRQISTLSFEGPAEQLNMTENTQPALLTASVAAFQVAQRELGFTPKLVAGHSLGEYSALVAAGAISFEEAVSWVHTRGCAMQRAVPAGQGTMAAILGLDEVQVEQLCNRAVEQARQKRKSKAHDDQNWNVEAWVQPANFNAPGQVVIAGSADAIVEVQSLIQDGAFSGAKAKQLPVSAPFHSRLMRPAREEMAGVFSKALKSNPQTVQAPQCPYIPNRTAQPNEDPANVLELLIEQIDHPVLWTQSIQYLIKNGYHEGVEFGPGKVLGGLAKRIAKSASSNMNIHPMGTMENFKNLQEILGSQS